MPKNKRGPWTDVHFEEGVQAVLYISNRQVKVIKRKVPEFAEQGRDEQVLLVIAPHVRGMDLSNLTERELDLFQYTINMACDLARPICHDLDAQTEEARLRNDTRFRRLWRAEPRIIDFTKESHSDQSTDNQGLPEQPSGEGSIAEHNESIQE